MSGTANYMMNKKLVFKSRTGYAKSAAQYILLAAFVLAGNTVMLSTLAGTLGMNRLIAKLVTEAAFFVINWTVQRYVIFHAEEEREETYGSMKIRRGYHDTEA